MWLRFILISLLNIAANAASILILVIFLLPVQTPSLVLNLVNWLIVFLLAFLFAEWAFAQQSPDRRGVILLGCIHAVIAITAYTVYGIIQSDRGPLFVISPEIVMQIAFELMAIAIAAYRIRRRRMRAALGEGMEI